MPETTTSTEIIRQAPFLEDRQKELLDVTFARGSTPFDADTFDRLDTKVAGLDPLTLQAMKTGAGIGQFMPYLDQASGTTDQGIDFLRSQGARAPGYFAEGAETARGR